MFENDEKNDTGNHQIIILTVLVRKYRAMGFGLQNKELEAVYFGWKVGFVCCLLFSSWQTIITILMSHTWISLKHLTFYPLYFD